MTATPYIPQQMKEAGLQAAHSFPLVSNGKQADGSMRSFRVPSRVAWEEFPSIELRAGHCCPTLTFDVDGPSVEVFLTLLCDQKIPRPNFTVRRVASGNLHVTYTLAVPVLRGENARRKPLSYCSTVAEYFRSFLKADRGYGGILTHNPLWAGPELQTWWGGRGGYTLGDLAAYIPSGWTRPPVPTTEAGRNCELFEKGMSFAGSVRNAQFPVLDYLQGANAGLDKPLAFSEVQGIARSVEKYREKWDFYPIDPDNARRCQAAGVYNRNTKAEALYLKIAQWHLAGRSIRSLAKEFHVAKDTALRACHLFRVVTTGSLPGVPYLEKIVR